MCSHIVRTPPPLYLKKWGIDLTKNPKKGGGWKNCWWVGGILRTGDAVSLGIFSSWGVANVTNVIFNYILVIVFLFPLNVGVSPCFHCTVLVPVYRVYTSCFIIQLLVPVTGNILSVCIMQVLLVSAWACGFNLFLRYVISQELMRECTYTV